MISVMALIAQNRLRLSGFEPLVPGLDAGFHSRGDGAVHLSANRSPTAEARSLFFLRQPLERNGIQVGGRNCERPPSASLSGEGSGEGRRGFAFLYCAAEIAMFSLPGPRTISDYPIK